MLPRLVDHKEHTHNSYDHYLEPIKTRASSVEPKDLALHHPLLNRGKQGRVPSGYDYHAQRKAVDDVCVRYSTQSANDDIHNRIRASLMAPLCGSSAEEKMMFNPSGQMLAARPLFVKPLDHSIDLTRMNMQQDDRPGTKERARRHVPGLSAAPKGDEDYPFDDPGSDLDDGDDDDDDDHYGGEKKKNVQTPLAPEVRYPLIEDFDDGARLNLFAKVFNHRKLSDIMTDDEQGPKLHEAVLEHFNDLICIFNFFSIDTEEQTIGRMTSSLWIKFCVTCKVRDKKVPESALTRVFEHVTYEEEKPVKKKKKKAEPVGPPLAPALSLAHFLEALVRLCVVKFANSKKASVSDRFSQLYKQHLRKFGLLAAPVPKDFRPAMRWTRVVHVIEGHLDALRVRFDNYAEECNGEKLITYERFDCFLRDYNMYDTDLTLFRLMKAFLCSNDQNQRFEAMEKAEAAARAAITGKKGRKAKLQAIVVEDPSFALALHGWLEILARMSAIKYRNLPLSKAMEELFNILLGPKIVRGVRGSNVSVTMVPRSEKYYEIASSRDDDLPQMD